MPNKFLSVMALLGIFLWAAGSVQAADIKSLPEVVATVNGEPVLASQLEKPIDILLRKWHEDKGTDSGKKAFEEVTRVALMQEIQHLLLQQETRKYMIEITPEEVDREVGRLMVSQGGKKKFEENLKEAMIPMDMFRTQVWDFIAAQKLVGRLAEKEFVLTEKELHDFYKENVERFFKPKTVVVRHIVIEVPQNSSEAVHQAAKEKAEEALAKIKAGADFAKVAEEYSTDPSRLKGGLIGPLTPGSMPPEFEEAAFSLKEGEVSGVVKTRYGYHIIKADQVVPENVIPYEKAKKGIEIAIKQVMLEDAQKNFMKNLMDKADVQIFI